MPLYNDVVASRIEKYRAQMERDGSNDADLDTAILRYVVCQLVDAAFGGGGGGGSTSATTIAQGINQSSDIDTIVARLTNIDTNQLTQSLVIGAIDSSVDIDAILVRLLSIDNKALVQADIVAAINSAVDIDTLVNNLATIAGNTYPVGARTIAQSQSVAIASDQRVPIDSQQINGTAISIGSGLSNSGTQRVAIATDTKIGGYGYESKATLTRAANTTPYVANDVYGNSFELANIGAVGDCVILSGIRLQFNISALPSGMAGFLLFLYSATPPSAVTDNNAFSVPASDRLALLTPGGGIELGNAVLEPGGGSVGLRVDNLNIELKLAPGQSSLWGYLVTKTGFTPAGVSETAVITALTLGV